LRLCLATKFGSLRKAFKALDKAGTGTMTCQQLKDGLVDCGFPEAQRSKNFNALYKEFDAQGTGTISFSDFVGDAHEAPPEEQEDWQYLTTAEKWTRYCERTSGQVPEKPRPPVWQSDPLSSLGAIKESEEKKSRDLQRMRSMISQGIHKTESGLRLTAPHLLNGFQEETVHQYRREALETVELSSKRVRHALQESARFRNALSGCVQQLRSIEEESRRAEKMEFFSRQRQNKLDREGSDNRFRVSAILNLDMVSMFTDDDCFKKLLESRS
jgi:hypothetical protein